MPRPKRKHTNRKKDASINSTVGELDSKIMEDNININIKLQIWKAEVKDRIRDGITQLNKMQEQKMALYEHEFRNLLMGIPTNVLNTPVDINSEKFKSFILGAKGDVLGEQERSPSPTVAATTVRRRSKSASNVKYGTRASQRIQRIRSTSVDIYKTPKGRVRLSTIMSHKKYTVTKPKKVQDSGVNVKRIMKPDEEAISTCGSPLYVAPSNLHAPHVNIPLPGGVVLNIEPKSSDGPFEIPGLDPKTKNQIKLLCEQLKKFC